MSELSAATGLTVPTIKYYLREGLVSAGARTAVNQADYDQGHVHRLRLIRALVEVGDLPIATVGAVLAALDDASRSTHDVLGVVHHALAFGGARAHPLRDADEAVAEIEQFIAGLGWQVAREAPSLRELARILATLRRLGWDVTAEVFRRYADAADALASWELEQTDSDGHRSEVVEGAVVGTVLFEGALVALRRLAEEHHSASRFASKDQRRPSQPAG